MKKILLVMSVAILIALCSAPSIVYAADYQIGVALCSTDPNNSSYYEITPVYVSTLGSYGMCVSVTYYNAGNVFRGYVGSYTDIYYYNNADTVTYCSKANTISGCITTLYSDYTWLSGNDTRGFFISETDFYNAIPEEYRPAPSIAQQRWDAFYEWYKNKFGFYPVEGSLIDLLRKLALGDEDANTEITILTFAPTPTPNPTPTPIPVQTIFVPDGNGNTTIIYQYTDPTTGVITQSPYNPNIQNNIEIDCDCDGDTGNSIFSPDPQDPAALTSSMLWADGFGVEITDNPLTAANDSQKSLAEAAAEYSDSVNVVSNSFNILPFKWLGLVGLLGGILIIAGLIRTFLGG